MNNIVCFFVNYNNSQKSIQCIESIKNLNNHNYSISIFIIDNNSIETEKNLLKEFSIDEKKFSHIAFETLFLEENIGYFPALNYGYTIKKNVVNNSDYTIIGNNDILFTQNFLSILNNRNYTKDIYVISPNIINSDSNHQNPQIIHRYSKSQLIYLDLYHSSYFMACILNFAASIVKFRGSQKSKPLHDKSQYISIGYGACYILTKSYYNIVDKIPSYLFLMNEENALSDIVQTNDGRIFYDSELIVEHLEHSAINLMPKLNMYKIVQNSYKISKKHFNNKYLFDKKISSKNV